MNTNSTTIHKLMLAAAAAVFVWSLINPHDYFTWFLEVAPAIIAMVVILATYKRFKLTTLVYGLIAIHAIILMIGGKYTYAEVPVFNWLRDIGIFARNNYDKVGHFVQGFVPAIVAREILIRTSPLKKGGWLFFIIVSICLAISAVYEIIEWLVSVATGGAGDSFLGTQGYVWDTQTDMALALVGAVAALILLGRVHDKILAKR